VLTLVDKSTMSSIRFKTSFGLKKTNVLDNHAENNQMSVGFVRTHVLRHGRKVRELGSTSPTEALNALSMFDD